MASQRLIDQLSASALSASASAGLAAWHDMASCTLLYNLVRKREEKNPRGGDSINEKKNVPHDWTCRVDIGLGKRDEGRVRHHVLIDLPSPRAAGRERRKAICASQHSA